MKTKYFFLIISILIFCSCDILRFSFENFKFEYFKVDDWSPSEDFFTDPEKIEIWLDFSNEPDRASIERNFLLTANGNQVKGNFIWEDKKMSFIPLIPYELNTDYAISLTQDAHDKKGYSMDEKFYFEFTTREDNTKPVLLSYLPKNYEVIEDLKTQIQLVFSSAIPLTALYNFVTITPSVNGSWHLENNNTKAVFTPLEQWGYGKRYEIRYSTSLMNNYGVNINDDFLSVFTVGTDNEEPYLLSAHRITKNEDTVILKEDLINEGWEKEDKLKLIFSEPVEWATVKNGVTVIPESSAAVSSLVMETGFYETENGFKNEFIFKFENAPAYESRFKIQIKSGIKDTKGNESANDYVFRIFANGELSKPPEFVGFRIPVSEENDNQFEYFIADNKSIYKDFSLSDDLYPPGEIIPAWIELYFDAAADINIFSLMELFRIETTNLVLTFSPRRIKTENFSVTEPYEGWEKYQRIEIAGYLTNSSNYGVIYVQVGAGLTDSLGNKYEKPQRISIIK